MLVKVLFPGEALAAMTVAFDMWAYEKLSWAAVLVMYFSLVAPKST
jgi:hypothetical protein